ncbi:MAG: threonylcarbamoyl-AMP synthase [Deltaproteobacteria bacterium]|nr:MAG: threonylcarbamoyl-AMP synthase [Deltaproteobacteria bacterium]
MRLEINPCNPQPRHIERVVTVLRNGGVIAYPTDTYYGIGCDLLNKKAIEKIYKLKQRDMKQAFSFICSDLKHISEYAKVSNYAYRTMKRLLPGPYTFILEGSKQVPRMMLTKRKTAGIRVPDHAICMALVNALGNPIISTSATLPGEETVLATADEIDIHLGSLVDIVIDGGAVANEPSSIISLIQDTPEIIREGAGDISWFLLK